MKNRIIELGPRDVPAALLSPPVHVLIFKRDTCGNCQRTMHLIGELDFLFNTTIYTTDIDDSEETLAALPSPVKGIIGRVLSNISALPIMIRVSDSKIKAHGGTFANPTQLLAFIQKGLSSAT